MSVKNQLIEEIRYLRDNYMVIDQVIPFETLIGEDVAVHPKSQELLACIEKILKGSKEVESILKKWVLQEKKTTVLLPDEDKFFIEDVVNDGPSPIWFEVREGYLPSCFHTAFIYQLRNFLSKSLEKRRQFRYSLSLCTV